MFLFPAMAAAIRVCFVGCGRIAKLHLNALQSLKESDGPPLVRVVGLVDPVEEAALRLKQCLPTDDAESCQIFPDIDSANQTLTYDTAIIMVPHYLHVECAKKCINAGKHVLLEKPVATTVSGCKELIELVESSNKEQVIMIGENSRYWPEVVYAKKLIDEGAIGEVYHGQANYWESLCGNHFHAANGTVGIPSWVQDSDMVGGGVLMDGTIHWIRSLRILLGDIIEVQGMLSHPWKWMKGESLSHSLLRHANGIPGVLHAHMMDIPMTKIPFFQIFGSKGEISIHGDFNGGITVSIKGSDPSVQSTLGGYMASFPPQMAEFISRVKDGRPLTQSDGGSVWEGTRDIMVSMAIYESAKSKKWETVQSI